VIARTRFDTLRRRKHRILRKPNLKLVIFAVDDGGNPAE
jgi:hypothetical protein